LFVCGGAKDLRRRRRLSKGSVVMFNRERKWMMEDRRGDRWIVAVLIALALLALFAALFRSARTAEATDWDKSSVVLLSAGCVDGRPAVTVENHGSAMTGSVQYRWYQSDKPTGGDLLVTGDATFAAGEQKTFVLPRPYQVPVRFEIDQRPGHPGSSKPKAVFVDSCEREPTPTATATDEAEPTPTCTPTATLVPATATATLTPTATLVPATATATLTPTATLVPATATLVPATATATLTPTATLVPATATATLVPATATATVVMTLTEPALPTAPPPTDVPTALDPAEEPTPIVPACPVALSGLPRPDCCNSDTPQWCDYRLRLWMPTVSR